MATSQTARRMITRVLRGIGKIGRNATPTPDELEDSFDSLNDMLAAWNLEDLLNSYTLIEEVDLVADQSLYTVGSGGDINIARPDGPNGITHAVSVEGTSPNTSEIGIYIARSQREWQRIVAKETTSTRVSVLWYNPNYPLGELNVYPVPSDDLTIKIYVPGQLTQLDGLDDTILLPNGFKRAIKYNLGVEIAPEMRVKLPDGWEKQAILSKGAIKSKNIKFGKLELVDIPGVRGIYDVHSDTWR